MLPDDFIKLLESVIPIEQFSLVIDSFAVKKPTTFRVNTIKQSVEKTLLELKSLGFRLKPVSWLPYAFEIEEDQRRMLTQSDAFYQGKIYIQNLSSMAAVTLLDVSPEMQVLDLAAAPGGKTLQIAMLMQNKGLISAVEPVKNRFFKLKSNIENHGASIVKCYMKDGRAVGKLCESRFDRVLLDAPCSSEARFTLLDDESWAHWSLRKVKEVAHKQKRLILSAFDALSPGGVMIYCTCSFSPEENEAVVDFLLSRKDNAVVEKIQLPFNNSMRGLTCYGKKQYHSSIINSLRILPNDIMDGFYVCRIKKN